MKIERRSRRTSPQVSIVSMADVAFLLIIFFLVSTSFQRAPQLEVELPDADSGAPSQAVQAVTLGVDRDGAYSLDGRPVAAAELGPRLQPLVAAMSEPVVVVQADQQAVWQAVVTAMDLARALGVARLELAVRDPAEPGE